MRIGSLKKQLAFQAPQKVRDAVGSTTTTWKTIITVAGELKSVTGTEVMRGGAPVMIATHRVKIRFFRGLKSYWRIEHAGRYFNIVMINDQFERHKTIEILCKEGAA